MGNIKHKVNVDKNGILSEMQWLLIYFHAASVFLSQSCSGCCGKLNPGFGAFPTITKKVLWRTKALQHFIFCVFTLSINLIGLIHNFKRFSAETASGCLKNWLCLRRNPKEHHFVLSCALNWCFQCLYQFVICLIIQPLGTITSQLAFVFLQLKNNLFSSDSATTSSWGFPEGFTKNKGLIGEMFTYSIIRLSGIMKNKSFYCWHGSSTTKY